MLALTRIQQQDAFRKYCFEEYSRPDYLSRAVVLLVDSNFIIRAIRFNSSAFGIAAYSFGRGLTESSAWEDESASRALSATSNYYPAAGLSHQPAIVAKVVADTLKAAPPGIFGLMVERFITDTNAEIKYEYFHFKLAPIIKQAAKDVGVPIEWGGDWRTFKDGPHWQLPWEQYP